MRKINERRFFFLILLYCVFAVSAENFKLELIARSEYETGQSVIVNVRITNNSGSDAMFVYCQDGSIHKFRYPYCYYQIINEKNDTLKIMQPTDKVVNPISSQAFFNIKSGASTDFFEDGFDLSRFYDLKEGIYTLTCCYSTDAQKESQWYGAYADDYWEKIFDNSFWLKLKPDMDKCSKMLRKVPKIDITSEPVKIAIKTGLYLSREKALEIAENICAQEKWKWEDNKISITDQGSEWHIMTNNNSFGMNAVINIDKRTGEVITKSMTGP